MFIHTLLSRLHTIKVVVSQLTLSLMTSVCVHKLDEADQAHS